MPSLLYENTHELDIQNELIHCHCIIQEQNLLCKALGLKQILNDVASAVHEITWCKISPHTIQGVQWRDRK